LFVFLCVCKNSRNYYNCTLNQIFEETYTITKIWNLSYFIMVSKKKWIKFLIVFLNLQAQTFYLNYLVCKCLLFFFIITCKCFSTYLPLLVFIVWFVFILVGRIEVVFFLILLNNNLVKIVNGSISKNEIKSMQMKHVKFIRMNNQKIIWREPHCVNWKISKNPKGQNE